MTYKAKIKITLREGILDVQGKTVERALHSIGYENMNSVRIGKYVEMDIDAHDTEEAKTKTAEACEKLIANPIIEDYFIEIEGKEDN
jgi:phosphoribosylformylglycinamidine synthase PurS subunit